MAEVDVLLKLFDTLKDSSKDAQQMCQAILTNQTNISSYIKNLPLSDLKELLKDHAKQSGDEIGTCTETVESQTDAILEEVKTLKGKIKTMITVVVVAFSLFTIAGLIGVIVYKTAEEVTPTYQDEFYNPEREEEQHQRLRNEIIESIRKEFKDDRNKK